MRTPEIEDGDRDLFEFIRNATAAMNRVALIRKGTAWGTGFLVGKDLLLTNRHVLEIAKLDEFDVIFDYVKGGADLSSLPRYRIVESLAHSPKEDLDFQLVRLDRAVESNRGFFSLSPERPQTPGTIKVTIYGFPRDQDEKLQPLQFMPGEITTFINQPVIKRIGYSAQTRKGSSGSPVVALTGTVIGLHHWGQEHFDNFAIPMFAILDALTPEHRAKLSISMTDAHVGIATSEGGLQTTAEFATEVATIKAETIPSEPMKARVQLLQKLNSLNEVQFNQLLIAFNSDRPAHDLATASVGETGPVLERVPRFMNWLGTPGRPDVAQVHVALELLGYGGKV
jgi:V8-like Glu-specific endopeptidase